jgi:hypothetical protein
VKSGQPRPHGVVRLVRRRTARLHGQLQSLSQNKPKGGIRSMNTARTGLKSKALHEAKKFFWIFIYLWLCFGLFVLYKALILAEQHIERPMPLLPV